jgi:hypothetical protein
MSIGHACGACFSLPKSSDAYGLFNGRSISRRAEAECCSPGGHLHERWGRLQPAAGLWLFRWDMLQLVQTSETRQPNFSGFAAQLPKDTKPEKFSRYRKRPAESQPEGKIACPTKGPKPWGRLQPGADFSLPGAEFTLFARWWAEAHRRLKSAPQLIRSSEKYWSDAQCGLKPDSPPTCCEYPPSSATGQAEACPTKGLTPC